MLVDLLNAKHPTYDADTWRRYDALYRGGGAFRQYLDTFLPRNPQEMDEIYQARKKEAHYCGYVGAIVNFFAAKLLASEFTVRAKERIEGDEAKDIDAPPFYASFREDIDGSGTDLVDFMRDRFTGALVKGRSWWLVELPNDGQGVPVNRAEWEERDLGRVRLCEIENEQVLDWHCDDYGDLHWAIVHDIETRRDSPLVSRGVITERWRIIDRESVTTFEAVYDPSKEKRPDTASQVGQVKHGFSRVPLLRLGFVGMSGIKLAGKRVSPTALEGLWLVNQLADPQEAHFRTDAALDWNLKRTCYAMPVFNVESKDNPPTMGAGYYIMIGLTEKFGWTAPPVAHLGVMAERASKLKDEIYRVAHQMAQGVENNAATVGRSAQSKDADASATEVLLRVYGALVREAIKCTYDLVSAGRGDTIEFSIEGLDTFSDADAGKLIDNATKVDLLAIPSPTLKRELHMRVAEAMVHCDQYTKDLIRKEIMDGTMSEADVIPPEPKEEPMMNAPRPKMALAPKPARQPADRAAPVRMRPRMKANRAA